MKPHHQHKAVAKISSCQVYVISRRGIVQLGSSFGSTCIFLLFPMRVAGAHDYTCSHVRNTCTCTLYFHMSLQCDWENYEHLKYLKMFIVLRPITAKIRKRELATKPQTNVLACALVFSCLTGFSLAVQ